MGYNGRLALSQKKQKAVHTVPVQTIRALLFPLLRSFPREHAAPRIAHLFKM